MFAAIGQRRTGADAFGRASTALTTTSSAVAMALVNESRLDALAAGLKLDESALAGTAAVNRYLASRDPAQADIAKQRGIKLAEAIESLRTAAAELTRVQRFIKVLDPQIADYAQAIDGLIAATDAASRAGADRACRRLARICRNITIINVAMMTV